MSSRKRQFYAVEDVIDILFNGTPDSPEATAPPPFKRISMPSEPVKTPTVSKVEGFKFYSSPKPSKWTDSPKLEKKEASLENSDGSFESPKVNGAQLKLTLTEKSLNSPKCNTKITPKASETNDSKPSTPSWSHIFSRQSEKETNKKEQLSFIKQNPLSSWLKKTKEKPSEEFTQTTLDAGQKKFGVVQCAECSMVYELKSPEDEKLHLRYHDSYKDALKFQVSVAKNIPPVRTLSGGLQVFRAALNSGLQKSLVRKCEDIIKFANREMKTSFSEKLMSQHKAYICVDPVSSKVVGICIVEPIARAFPAVASSWPLVLERIPRKTTTGIRMIWVNPEWRRKGIAKELMETVRSTFVYGCVFSKREIAVSPPTEEGFYFYRSYFSNSQRQSSDGNDKQQDPTLVVYDI